MKAFSLFAIVGICLMTSAPALGGDGDVTVLINEIEADEAGTDTEEFIELYDGGVGNTDLTGLVVVLYNGSDDQSTGLFGSSQAPFDLDGLQTDGSGFFVIGGWDVPGIDDRVVAGTGIKVVLDADGGQLNSWLQNGADAVTLYAGNADEFPNDTPITIVNLIDAAVYDTNDADDPGLAPLMNPGEPQLNEDGGGDADLDSNQRCPDGAGGGRNTSEYLQSPPTPGASNNSACVADVLINETDADQAGTDTAEFIELYDGGVGNTALDGLVVVLFNGSDDQSYTIFMSSQAPFDLDGLHTDDNGFFVIGGRDVPGIDDRDAAGTGIKVHRDDDSDANSWLQNGADAVAIYAGDADAFPNDTPVTTDNLVDAIVYDTGDADDAGLLVLLNPGEPQMDERGEGPDDLGSNQRCPDGSGGARNTSTYTQAVPSAGSSNFACESVCGVAQAGDCFDPEGNGNPGCDDDECCTTVCDINASCCEVEWTEDCAALALVECRSCGDSATGDCFQDNGTPYCRDESCCSTVCAMNSDCCTGPWNQACADMAVANCAWDAPECGDVAFGLSESDPVVSMELVRGAAVENGGAQLADFWDGPFIQSVEFDNLDGISHNPQGNLLGVNFGSSATGGSIFSFATCSPPGAGDLIADNNGVGGDIDQTRLGGLSVSPNNDKIAVVGFDTGLVIVYDYTAGDCNGNGAALSGARQAEEALCTFSTQGTAWKDNDTVLAFSADGRIFEIDADSMAADLITTVDTVTGCGGFTDIEFAPGISDNVYAMYSRFTGGATHNLLFVLDPSDNLAVLGTFDYAESMQTAREIAFDVDGNLFISQFGDFGAALRIEFIPNGADLGSLADNNSLDWYTSGSESNFNGLDVAQCETAVARTLIVKQGACPAPVNPNSNGVIPMLLVGDVDFDVSNVDRESLELRRCDGVGGTATPLADHTQVKDLNHPFDGEVSCGQCTCNDDQSSDGIGDLSLKFRTSTTLEALEITAAGGVVGVELIGSLLDGSTFFARDCVVVVPPGGGQANATMQSNVSDTFIDVAPLDLNVDSDGFANFSRSYVSGTVVTVTAPATSQGRRFLRWSVDNVLQPFGVRTLDLTVGENTTMKAYYQRASRVRPDRPSAPSGDQE